MLMLYLKALWLVNPLGFVLGLTIFLTDYFLFSYALYRYTVIFPEEFNKVDQIIAWIPFVNVYVFGKLVATLKLITYIDNAKYILLAVKLILLFGFFFRFPIITMVGLIANFITTYGAFRQYFEIIENETAILPVACVIFPILGPFLLYRGTKVTDVGA